MTPTNPQLPPPSTAPSQDRSSLFSSANLDSLHGRAALLPRSVTLTERSAQRLLLSHGTPNPNKTDPSPNTQPPCQTINETKKIKNMAEFQRLSETFMAPAVLCKRSPQETQKPQTPMHTQRNGLAPTLHKTQRNWGDAVSSEP